jgi:serine protease
VKLNKTLVQAALCAIALGLTLPASAQSNSSPTPRVIVKWQKQAPAFGAGKLSPANALHAVRSRHGVGMTSVRTTATGGEVFKVERPYLSSGEVAALVADLSNDPAVEYAEADLLLQSLATPPDPLYNQQWHYYEATGGLKLPAAWDLTAGSGVRVAVIDTGYRPHVDLAANIIGGYDFISDSFVANDGGGRDSDARDPGDATLAGACGSGSAARSSSWHGTHVGGTVAGVSNNGVGGVGVAYRAKVVPIRVLGRCGGYTSDIADAIVWAAGGAVAGAPANPYPARVINLSLGGSGSCSVTTRNAINSARARGTVVIVSAGNSNTNAAAFTPANCAGVVTVAATARNGSKASYSNFGTSVDVAAPGGDFRGSAANGVLSTLNNGATSPGSDVFGYYQGTSMAAPHVAGTAALMLARRPTLTPDRIETILKSTARRFPVICTGCGTGIVDAATAVRTP